MRTVQRLRVDRLIELLDPAAFEAGTALPSAAEHGPFAPQRHAQSRHAARRETLQHPTAGIDGTPATAWALLAGLKRLPEVAALVAARIRARAAAVPR